MLTKKGKGKRNEKGHEYLIIYIEILFHSVQYIISFHALLYIMSRATAC